MIANRQSPAPKKDSRTGGHKPFIYAVAIHIVLLIFLGISIHWSWKDDSTSVMKAKVVDNKPVKKKQNNKTRLEAKKKKQAALKLKKKADRKRAEQKKRKQEAEERKRTAEESLRESLAAEEEEREEAERQARANEFADRYRAIIRQKVSRNWVKPGGSRKGLQCLVRVRLLASGDVLEATVIKSSGDALFDRSVENAVRKASPLPIPQEKDLFDYFREIEFLFNPEDNIR